MIFTSYTYVYFLTFAFLLHWSLPRVARKPFLVAASYLFYCTWRWEFGFLLLAVSFFNWAYGRWAVAKTERAWALNLGIMINLAPLIYFKYTYFLLDNLAALAHLAGITISVGEHTPFIPLGISFFTFQGIAYLFDIAAGEAPFINLLDFLLFKAFWPQLIAGPIVRMAEMQEQLRNPRKLDYPNVAEGLRRILAGFFKKVVLADNLAPHIELAFAPGVSPNAVDCIAAMFGFGMQVYFDFSAYSDIAIGSALLFGYRLPENFNLPYAACSPQEFWNRWHMTLSHWIRDYLFTPINFAMRDRPALSPLWLFVAMAACGLWHGAAWTFVAWGCWHGVLLVLNQTLLKGFFAPADRAATLPNTLWKLAAWLATFLSVQAAWLFFRAQSVGQAWRMLLAIITLKGGLRPAVIRENAVLLIGLVFTGMLAAHVIIGKLRASAPRSMDGFFPRVAWALFYTLLGLAVIIFDLENRTFVYFQF